MLCKNRERVTQIGMIDEIIKEDLIESLKDVQDLNKQRLSGHGDRCRLVWWERQEHQEKVLLQVEGSQWAVEVYTVYGRVGTRPCWDKSKKEATVHSTASSCEGLEFGSACGIGK